MGYLNYIETGGIITVYTDGDTLVFGNTYSANIDTVLSTNNFIKITETNLVSCIYADSLFQYGTGISDLSGTSYSSQTIATDFIWFPLTADANTNAVTRLAQYQDNILVLTAGEPIISGTGYTNIGIHGFATDGAWHIKPQYY